ncbi:nicotinamide riboside transporter PnuC, partial [bacterium]
FALFLVGTGLQGYLLHLHTDAAAPYIDSGIFWASVGAQWMVGRKYVENWLVWIAVDVIAAMLYWSKGLPVTSALYLLFCVLAVGGWVAWLRSGRQVGTIETHPAGPPINLP